MPWMSTRSTSPPPKRIRLESDPLHAGRPADIEPAEDEGPSEDIVSELQCSICLQETVDRTVIPTCSHEFCLECIRLWSEQSRRCPLCSQSIGTYLIHNIRSKYDFRKYFLMPLRTSSPPVEIIRLRDETVRRRRTAREREREQRLRQERQESDRLQRAITRRRWIYEHGLYAKHVASNAYTRYRPFPTPAQFAASTEYISRTTIFLRRELQVWDDLDVEFLTTFVVSLMKSIDIRSDSAIKLLAEFLDMDPSPAEGRRHANAEHFAHEIYCYVRSPFRDLFVYDSIVQYDGNPPEIEEMPRQPTHVRWGAADSRRLGSRSPSRSHYVEVHSLDDRSRPNSPSAIGGNVPNSTARRSSSPVIAGPQRTMEDKGETDPLAPNQQGNPESAQHDNTSGQPNDPENAQHNKPLDSTKTLETKEGANSRGTRPEDAQTGQPCDTTDSTTDIRPPLHHDKTPPMQESGRQRKPPRTRSLLDSVQAHLSVGGSVARRGFVRQGNNTKMDDSPAPDFSGRPSPIPVLLARLSDTAIKPCNADGYVTTSDEATAIVKENKIRTNGTSAPEIMARARARARARALKNDTTVINPLGISGPSIECGKDTPTPRARSRDLAGREEPYASEDFMPTLITAMESPRSAVGKDRGARTLSGHREGDTAPPSSYTGTVSISLDHQTGVRGGCHATIDRPGDQSDEHDDSTSIKVANPVASHRFKLLARLGTERCQANGANADPSHMKTSSAVSGQEEIGRALRRSVEAGVDPESIEAKLRKRAQLQVRLAAEKRGCK